MAAEVWQVGQGVPGVRRGQQGVQAWEEVQRRRRRRQVRRCWLWPPAADRWSERGQQRSLTWLQQEAEGGVSASADVLLPPQSVNMQIKNLSL